MFGEKCPQPGLEHGGEVQSPSCLRPGERCVQRQPSRWYGQTFLHTDILCLHSGFCLFAGRFVHAVLQPVIKKVKGESCPDEGPTPEDNQRRLVLFRTRLK